ncbi:MAG: hypothetical protein ABTQ34_00560 [Bdellovibrionales bacterium]
MPYVFRSEGGQIYRIGVKPVPGAEPLPHDHPEVRSFLVTHGQDPAQIDNALSELRRTDNEMARAVEDVITVLLRKNILKLSELPKAVQERMALRVRMRVLIQEAYDRASVA